MAATPHIYFLPMMAPGHMIPMVNIARQFSRMGAKCTIITTPLNASQFSQTILNDQKQGLQITTSILQLPYQEAGLPEGCENLSSISTLDMSLCFFRALDLLQEPVRNLLQQGDPDCIITGGYFWWTTYIALKLNIPRLVFYGSSFFSTCIVKCLKEHKPYDQVQSKFEEFVLPNLPGEVRISTRQIPDAIINEDKHPLAEIAKKARDADSRGYGMIMNSFYELEPDYANHYKHVYEERAWHIGPVSLFNNNTDERGKEYLKWLDSKNPNSVAYACFGSMSIMSPAQLVEIAKGLEASGVQFIWVVRGNNTDELPDGFEKRVEERGLIIKGWAPQVEILQHEAVGGFVTHCGWNSILEGVAAGVPMVTWPLSAEQFFNEKLVVEILKTGTPVGASAWSERTDEKEVVNGDKLERAVKRLMVEEEGEGMRIRARELGILARRAVEKGGSSYGHFESLLEEITTYGIEKSEVMSETTISNS